MKKISYKKTGIMVLPILLLVGLAVGGKVWGNGPNYSNKKEDFLKTAKMYSDVSRKFIAKKLGDKTAIRVTTAATKNFKERIPKIPYIGDRNIYLNDYIAAAFMLSLIEALEKKGLKEREIGEIIYLSAESGCQKTLNPLIVFYMRYFKLNEKDAFDYAAKFTGKYKYDWAMTPVKGDGKNYDYGADYTECGIVKLYKKFDKAKYVKYLCLCDYAAFGALGVELKRTETLGNGGKKCDFRYKVKGGKPKKGWPPEKMIEFNHDAMITSSEDKKRKKTGCSVCSGCGGCGATVFNSYLFEFMAESGNAGEIISNDNSKIL